MCTCVLCVCACAHETLFSHFPAAIYTNPCEAGWEFVQGKCYKMFVSDNRTITWYQANATCSSLNAYLIVLDTRAEIRYIGLYALAHSLKFSEIWIGLTDLAVEGTFVWVNGFTLSETGYNNFASRWHNGGMTENCVHAVNTLRSEWYNRDCEFKAANYMCEKSKYFGVFCKPLMSCFIVLTKSLKYHHAELHGNLLMNFRQFPE